MFRVRSVSLRPRTKIALLTLAWLVWWLVAAGGVTTVFAAQCYDQATTETRTCEPCEVDISGNVTQPCNNQAQVDQAVDRAVQNTVINQDANNYDGPAVGGGGGTISSEERAALEANNCDEACQEARWRARTSAPAGDSVTSLEDANAQVVQQQQAAQSCPGCDVDTALAAGMTTQAGGSGSASGGGGTPASGGSASGAGGTPASGGAVSGTGASSGGAGTGVSLRNPLAGISTIPDLLAAILNVVIIIAIPIIIFFLMLAGFKYVTARGNPSTISEASQALLYAIIGGVLILGATAIAQIIKNLVNAFRS